MPLLLPPALVTAERARGPVPSAPPARPSPRLCASTWKSEWGPREMEACSLEDVGGFTFLGAFPSAVAGSITGCSLAPSCPSTSTCCGCTGVCCCCSGTKACLGISLGVGLGGPALSLAVAGTVYAVTRWHRYRKACAEHATEYANSIDRLLYRWRQPESPTRLGTGDPCSSGGAAAVTARAPIEFWRALAEADVLAVTKALARLNAAERVHPSARDAAGVPALVYAAAAGDRDIVETLLEFGADAEATGRGADGEPVTAMQAAAAAGHVDLIALLHARRGVSYDQAVLALRRVPHPATITWLRAHAGDAARPPALAAALHEAAARDDVQAIEMLLDKGALRADQHACAAAPHFGPTPLRVALEVKAERAAAYLLGRGASATCSVDGDARVALAAETPLSIAVGRGCSAGLLSTLIACGARPTAEHLRTALRRSDDVRTHTLLIDAGVRLDRRHVTDCAKRGDVATVTRLVRAGAPVDTEHLSDAITAGDADILAALLSGKAPVEDACWQAAIAGNSHRVLEALLELRPAPVTAHHLTAAIMIGEPSVIDAVWARGVRVTHAHLEEALPPRDAAVFARLLPLATDLTAAEWQKLEATARRRGANDAATAMHEQMLWAAYGRARDGKGPQAAAAATHALTRDRLLAHLSRT